MNISKGVVQRAKKVVIYGPEGIGKSTLAAQFPDVVFSDTEDSTLDMDVARLDKPTSWTMLLQQIEFIKANKPCQTYAVDTADWAEKLCKEFVVSKSEHANSIEDFGYGKGYTMLAEEWGKFLNKLSELTEVGINVVLTAHSQIKKFEQPDELGAYDRYELKLEKKTAPLTKEWADMILFANYKTMVVNVDNQGAAKGKNKAQGGQRVLFTTHHPAWDAKNRYGLPDEIPMDYSQISHIIVTQQNVVAPPVQQEELPVEIKNTAPVTEPNFQREEPTISKDIPKALVDLMGTNNVTEVEIQQIVSQKGYYTFDTPIANYDPGFISGVLVAAWNQVYPGIEELRKNNNY
ncbi:hypothetical protein CKN61_12875 [Carnobacterium divergens]|uniref:ATP-binding protein n=1 Tax=Carnobacterium divergens TaxID=2748 RepID=UPI0010738C26|nr:ATP-binding protein [Carnobacterium divergens]TFI86932.1 hypothetical protein CKN61_12875 [Carnobacterium divergens]